MEREVFIWLGLLIMFLAVEIATVGLTSIWLAGGAVAALLFTIAGLNIWWQAGAFLAKNVLKRGKNHGMLYVSQGALCRESM